MDVVKSAICLPLLSTSQATAPQLLLVDALGHALREKGAGEPYGMYTVLLPEFDGRSVSCGVCLAAGRNLVAWSQGEPVQKQTRSVHCLLEVMNSRLCHIGNSIAMSSRHA